MYTSILYYTYWLFTQGGFSWYLHSANQPILSSCAGGRSPSPSGRSARHPRWGARPVPSACEGDGRHGMLKWARDMLHGSHQWLAKSEVLEVYGTVGQIETVIDWIENTWCTCKLIDSIER